MKNKNFSDIEIPLELYSFAGNNLFEHCIDCDRYLLDDGTEYFIEKAIKKYPDYNASDVIFEYAICSDCVNKMRQRMSKESLQKIENFFIQNVDLDKRMEIIKNHSNNPAAWTSECLVNGKPKEQLEEFQIYAHCNGRHLVLQQMPYIISGEVIEQLSELLSKETKDELDNFMSNHFGPPPELREPLTYKKVVLI